MELKELVTAVVETFRGGKCVATPFEAEKSPYVAAEIKERKKRKEGLQKWKDEQAQFNAVTQTSHELAAHIYRNNFGAYGNPYASALPMAATVVHSPPIPLEN